MDYKYAVNFTGKCRSCGKPMAINRDVIIPNVMTFPQVRAQLVPSSNILVYRITSDEIREFITRVVYA